jgi:hypothetical protein
LNDCKRSTPPASGGRRIKAVEYGGSEQTLDGGGALMAKIVQQQAMVQAFN